MYFIFFKNRLDRLNLKIGDVTTIAGSGSAAYADGIGESASFFCPVGLVIDSSGVLFVADQYNHRIRKIMTSGC